MYSPCISTLDLVFFFYCGRSGNKSSCSLLTLRRRLLLCLFHKLLYRYDILFLEDDMILANGKHMPILMTGRCISLRANC